MDNGAASAGRWMFGPNDGLAGASAVGIRAVLSKIFSNIDKDGRSPVIPLGHGDPSAFPCFRTTPVAEDAIVAAVRSAKYNCYAPTFGIAPARCAIAERPDPKPPIADIIEAVFPSRPHEE